MPKKVIRLIKFEVQLNVCLNRRQRKLLPVTIAPRLSTLLEMDRILVFDKGQIVEDGSHTQLVRRKGMYAKLLTSQVSGFLSDEKE